jgi:hypothetical protein
LVIAIQLENNALPDGAPLFPNDAGRLSAFKPPFFFSGGGKAQSLVQNARAAAAGRMLHIFQT